jgi:hypothetical protein
VLPAPALLVVEETSGAKVAVLEIDVLVTGSSVAGRAVSVLVVVADDSVTVATFLLVLVANSSESLAVVWVDVASSVG